MQVRWPLWLWLGTTAVLDAAIHNHPLQAQAAPDSAQCARAIRDIAIGNVDAARSAWSHLPWCQASPQAGAAAAAAIERMGRDWRREESTFEAYSAGIIRDDRVFDAAFMVAASADAALEARLAALAILVRQHDPNLSGTLGQDGTCDVIPNSEYWSAPSPWTDLTADRRARMPLLLNDIAHDRSARARLRQTAGCVARQLGIVLRPDARPAELAVVPRCPLRLQITNRAPEGVVLRVHAQGEGFGVNIDAGRTQTVSLSSPGEVRVFLGDSLIWIGNPPESPCPP
jgi:hypothetical protein